jgi:hypothetical protein
MSIFDYCTAIEEKLKRRDATIRKLREQIKAKDEAMGLALVYWGNDQFTDAEKTLRQALKGECQ